MDMLLECLDAIIESQIWPEKKASEIIKILLYVQGKGYLYTSSIGKELKAVLCAYRINEGDDLTKIPLEEKGNILYVPFIVSMKKEENLFNVIRESCKIYLDNNPDIEEIILEDKNNKIKRYKLKGAEDGKRESVNTT